MSINVEASAFGAYPIAGETVIVTGSQAAEIALSLEAAGERFLKVNDVGREYTDEEYEAMVHTGGRGEHYTPNYVSEVEEVPGGHRLYVDCKGQVESEMRATFIAILREELTQHGVTNATVFSPVYDEHDGQG